MQDQMIFMGTDRLLVRQVHEVFEWLGFETRNKYEILSEEGTPLGFAAEQRQGFWGAVSRNFLGHWRTFEIHVFDSSRQLVLRARHPFRFFFQELEVFAPDGRFLGGIQQRFSILSKRFDLKDPSGSPLMEVSSPLWRPWTFPFLSEGRTIAAVRKRWSGAFSELLTDRDTFLIELIDPGMSSDQRALILASAFFVDLQYFEKRPR